MKRKITLAVSLCCLIFAVLAGCNRIPVQAAERKEPPYILNTRQECTLTIRTGADHSAAGEKLALYQVGRIDGTSLSLSFVLSEPFEGADVDLMAIGQEERRQTIEKLWEYAAAGELAPERIVELDENGEASLEVSQGAYLICQAEQSSTKIQATLVGVPYVSESLNEWVYNMNVQLKAVEQSVPTGDTQNAAGYTALAIATVLLLLLLLLARRRAKKK